MTPILTFTREEGLGREVATLGAVRVGQIMQQLGARRQACYAVWLPDVPRQFVPADSVFVARSAIARVVEDWLNRTGVFGPGDGVEVRLSGEDDGEERAPLRQARRA